MSETHDLRAPLDWVQRHIHHIPKGGAVLDLAAGRGRHSRLLLEAGYHVTAADRDVSGLADLDGIRTTEIDLETEDWPFAAAEFAGIVVTNYLHRPLFSHMIDALADGGVLIYQTFAVGNEVYGRPKNPDFLLRTGELLAAFTPALSVIAYQHGIISRPEPAVIQRIAAIKSDAPQEL
ncbi:MAG: class I SAM-dependent methyltransferase [Rhodospirillaceae bacterium]|nr:class I SAM-dependent methyltransferase [Rhodospirillaceae bacterium]